ncbi:GDSL-type esterase/lipase family protein [Dysgonomonas sp. ZJ709]|uniref:GDSL-type esterase/lipase family protein n=1 Tax=Dysgonomonas sp. ZJ709 TaxID=2709797 RepID=UPI0013ED6FB8|nr:GDSL-type esterase/lipase family protein [Dysgonomonas sp. ZJ709]
MRIKFATLLLFFSVYVMGQEIQENIQESQTYIDRMAYFKQHPLTEGQIIFLGNSLTQAGKWDEYFPNQQPVNRGIAGDNTEGMLARIDEIIAAKPKKLFIMAGINDISLSRSNKKIINNISTMIVMIKEGSPDTQIYLQSVLPINNEVGIYSRLKKKEKTIEKLNKELHKLSKKENLVFINIYPSFLIKKRQLDARYTTDGLHLNEEGYTVWVNQIQYFVEEN